VARWHITVLDEVPWKLVIIMAHRVSELLRKVVAPVPFLWGSLSYG
jgi:hypothetical protein